MTRRSQSAASDVASREKLTQLAREHGWKIMESKWRRLIARRDDLELLVEFNGHGTKQAQILRDGERVVLVPYGVSERFGKVAALIASAIPDAGLTSM